MLNVTREEFEKNLTKAINEKKKRELRKMKKMDDEQLFQWLNNNVINANFGV